MRSPLRSLAASALLALAALVVASSAALAGNASPGRFTFSDEWCFDDVVLVYCFDNDGSVQFVEFADGDGWVKISARQRTVVYEDGVVVGESFVVSNDRSVYIDGGRANLQSVVHTRASFGDQTCVSNAVLKITDFEVVLDHSSGPVCN